jgi:hypothetical protein
MTNWSTPNCTDGKTGSTTTQGRSLVADIQLHGQAAPASSSSLGSRQGLSEQDWQNWQTFAHGTHNRGETPHRQVVKALVKGEKVKTQCLTVDQVFAEEIKGTKKQWRTPTSFDWKNHDCSTQVYLSDQVEGRMQKQDWRTPGASDGEGGVMEMREGCAGKYKLRDHVVAVQKQWATPQASDHIEGRRTDLDSNQKCLGRDMKQWATPRTGATESTRPNNKGGIPLADQAKRQWATPKANEMPTGQNAQGGLSLTSQNNNGKLNPRWVETLMGLPVGWTMPSCTQPVTIAPTNCDSLATESCRPQQSERGGY